MTWQKLCKDSQELQQFSREIHSLLIYKVLPISYKINQVTYGNVRYVKMVNDAPRVDIPKPISVKYVNAFLSCSFKVISPEKITAKLVK